MIKKGMTVEFTLNNAKRYGYVISGGKKVKVQFKRDENYLSVTGTQNQFCVVTPKMDESGIMSKYTITKYKSAGGEETERFEAQINLDGKPIAMVSNGGYGGCNDYYNLVKNDDAEFKQFFSDTKDWMHHFKADTMEPDSSWVSWYNFDRTFVVSAKEYWDDWNKALIEFGLQ